MNVEQTRYNYIDIIKGLLIFIVIIHHIIGLMNNYGYPILILEKLYVPFFMPAFFVVTGFCSNFNKPKSVFLKTELKRLLIPSVCFFIINRFFIMLIDGTLTSYNVFKYGAKLILSGGSWFLIALLVSKMIYYFINSKFNKKKCMILSTVGLGIASLACWIGIFEVWYIWHALGLMIFISVGQILKKIKITLVHFIFAAVTYVCYVMILVLFDIHIPRITSQFSMYPWEILHFFVGAVSGTIIVWCVGIVIHKNKILEYFGKNSLVVFLTHWIILKAIISVATDTNINYILSPYVFLIITFIVICAICALLVELINMKYFKWMIGKI